MIDERLYINGQLVDIGTDTKITLQVKSNLFRDVSKIVSNTSYTVKLPKTVRNQMLLEHTDLVQGDVGWPYLMHTARYFRNGVEVIKDGRASVLAVTDEAIEITIVWGLYSNFSELISKGTQLNAIEGDERLVWSGNNTADTYANAAAANYFYADIDVWTATEVSTYWNTSNTANASSGSSSSGSGTSTGTTFGGHNKSNKTYLHPCAKVSWVLEKIKANTGVEFKWTGDAKEYIDTLILPLINKKANDLTFDSTFAAGLPAISGSTLGTIIPTIKTSSNIFTETGGTATQLTVIADAKVYIKISCKATYDLSSWTHKGSLGWNFDGCFVMMMVTKTDGTVNWYTAGTSRGGQTTGRGRRSANFADWPSKKFVDELEGVGVIELEQGDKISFGVYYAYYSGFGNSSVADRTYKDYQITSRKDNNPPTTFNGGTIEVSATGSDDTVPAGGYFPICYNLPKVKIIDFVKFLAAITGTFPLQMATDGIVEFVPLATIWNNKAEAKDWTRRLLPQTGENKPKNMEFTLSDFAQHNYYKWKKDKYVSGSYDGDLQVANETLSTERTVLEFPFSATDGNNVPMYTGKESTSSTTTDDDGPEYSACTDRILRLGKDSDGNAVGYFDINMQEILNDKYKEVAETLQYAKVVKETMRIRDIELLEFDETKPVFLAQYGAYFAVNSIKSDANGLAEVELLKLQIY